MNGEHVNHNHRFSKWMSGVLCTLAVIAVVSLIQMGRAIGELQVRQQLMDENVAKNTRWIADWYAVLKVPERDQHQDSAIQELTRQLRIIEGRMSNEEN